MSENRELNQIAAEIVFAVLDICDKRLRPGIDRLAKAERHVLDVLRQLQQEKPHYLNEGQK